MRGISVLAIVVGGVCDIVLSATFGVPFILYVVSTRGLSHLQKGQHQAAISSAIHGSAFLYATQLGIGLACSVVGGFVAASIARERRILNGVLASWLCVGIGVYYLFSGRVETSLPVHIVLIAVTPVCYLFGAKLRMGRSSAKPVTV
jgi:hypothetical protein